MTEAPRELEEKRLVVRSTDGSTHSLKLLFVIDKGETLQNDDGTTSYNRYASVQIISDPITARIRVTGEDYFTLLYRALFYTDQHIRLEAQKLGLDVYHFEPGDADGPMGIFAL